MTNSPLANLRRRILHSRGLTYEDIRSIDHMLPAMKQAERRFRTPIEALLAGDTGECAALLGVGRATVLRWRRRLEKLIGEQD